jgi:hypothetical protein
MSRLVLDALDRDPTIGAVYSIGGSNVATIRAFEQRGRRYRVFIAHDLDEDNRMLLRARKISAVLHHDLRADANRAGRMIIQAHGGMSGSTCPCQPVVSFPQRFPTIDGTISEIHPKGLKTKHHNERHAAHLRRVETPASGGSSAQVAPLHRCNGATCVTLRPARWRPRGGGR